jgi:hypothetical protein
MRAPRIVFHTEPISVFSFYSKQTSEHYFTLVGTCEADKGFQNIVFNLGYFTSLRTED